MLFLRSSLLLMCVFGPACWAADATAPKSVKQIEATVSLTNVPSSFGEEIVVGKSTEKRDSRGQLGTFHFAKNNDGPFRPMLPPDYLTDTSRGSGAAYQESASSSYLSAAAASPQVYYDTAPPQFKYGTHFKDSPRPEGGITYASSAYRGPFHIEHQASAAPTASSSHQGLHEVASPKQVQAYFEDARPKLQAPPPPSHYPLPPPQQHHQQQHHQHHQPQLQSHQTQQQQFQYIIAIPLSYVRRLQQQMGGSGAGHHLQQQPQQYITPISGAPQHHLQELPATSKSGSSAQIVGPLARDHSGAYRPYQAPSMANPNVQYVMRYIQVPINSPLLYQKQMPVVYSMPSSYYQPAYPEINQPQPQHQHHHHQATLRYESKQPEAGGPTVRYSSSSAPPALGKPHASKLVAPAPPPPPAPTYSSVYVTPPPSPHLPSPFNYVRFAQPGLNGPTPYSLPPFNRLPPVHMSAAAASPGLSDLLQTTQQHYYALPHGREMVYPMQSPVAGHVYTPQEAALPYFNHPAGVHYGTHLYHPQALLKNSLAAAEAAEVAGNQEAPASQQQHHQQQQQEQTSYVKHPAPGNGYAKVSSSGGGSGSGATAPTTTAPAAGVTPNIVKYP